ncbi:DUF1266 domain-containing protein [Streptomyces buecherae]|nr:DUF1266 domain-containing protein [Streptomyces buecherae]
MAGRPRAAVPPPPPPRRRQTRLGRGTRRPARHDQRLLRLLAPHPGRRSRPPDQAWSAIAAAVELTRPAYASWEEFDRSFLAGRMCWQLGTERFGQPKAEGDGERWASVTEHLLTRDDRPRRQLPW